MLVSVSPFTKYKGMEAIFVRIHQYQLSTFFLVINHMPVKAAAEARASAQGIAPSKNKDFSCVNEKNKTI